MSSQPHLRAVSDHPQAQEPEGSPAPNPTTAPASGGATPPGGGAAASGANRAQKQRSDRSLPSDRLSHDKQVDILRSIAQLSGPSKRSVTAEDLSAAIGLKGHTGGLSNKFFRDSGWVDSAGRGAYAATDALLEYNRHLNIDARDTEGARQYLAGPAQSSWYWEALEPILDGGLRKPIALLTLSKSANAHDHTAQLELVLTWLEWLGLVRQEGDLIFRVTEGDARAAETVSASEVGAALLDELFSQQVTEEDPVEEPQVQEQQEDQEDQEEDAMVAPLPRPQPASSTVAVDTSALISFNFSVRITAEDAAKLSPEQLQSVLDFAEKLRG